MGAVGTAGAGIASMGADALSTESGVAALGAGAGAVAGGGVGALAGGAG